MLLSNNTEKVINLLDMYENLSDVDKIRLALYLLENKNFSIEMLFNIFETDFKDKVINKEINKHLYVYDYCYAILNK